MKHTQSEKQPSETHPIVTHPIETRNNDNLFHVKPAKPLTLLPVHTGCSLVVGDLAYMAPEVLGTFANPRESKVTTAADIWGIACVLYEVLTGFPLFGGSVNENCEGDTDEQRVHSEAAGHAGILPDATNSHTNADSDFEICPVTLLVQSQQRLLVSHLQLSLLFPICTAFVSFLQCNTPSCLLPEVL